MVFNALLLVSVVVFTVDEWSLSEAFTLVPVFSLLFPGRTYIPASIGTLLALIGFVMFKSSTGAAGTMAVVNVVNSITIYLILILLIYLIAIALQHWDLIMEVLQESRTASVG